MSRRRPGDLVVGDADARLADFPSGAETGLGVVLGRTGGSPDRP